jgi:hypothetical protein
MDLSEFLIPDKLHFFRFLRDQGELDIVFKDGKVLGIDKVIFIRPHNVSVVADAPQYKVRLEACRQFSVQARCEKYPGMQRYVFPEGSHDMKGVQGVLPEGPQTVF